jgi:hypothetical protein
MTTQCKTEPPCDELEQTRSELRETDRVLGETRRRVTLVEDRLPEIEALAMEFQAAVGRLRADLELLRRHEKDTAGTAALALQRVSNLNGDASASDGGRWDDPDETTGQWEMRAGPRARILKSEVSALATRAAEAELARQKAEDERHASARWTRLYQIAAIVGVIVSLYLALFGRHMPTGH